MVLDSLILALGLSAARVQQPTLIVPEPMYVIVRSYDRSTDDTPPIELRDAPPIAYTDRFELRRPGRTYQNRR
jgi:hypothetical protein